MKWVRVVGLCLVGTYLYSKYKYRNPRSLMQRLNEPEDIDAYNADDMQPPFDEKAPRPWIN